MIDRADYTDHRMMAAQATNQSNRGWDFSRMTDEGPIWLRALVEITRPRSLILLAVIAGVSALWWL